MAQNIKIRKTNEKFETIENSNLNFADLNKYIYSQLNHELYPWAESIDEYGMTVFNLLQIKHLVFELDQIEKTITSPNLLRDINAIIKFIGTIERHEYIQFIGD